MSQPNQFELLSERRFGPLFWTQFLGALNDNLFKTAFIFLITYGVLAESRDAALWTPMLNGLLILPFFLFSATAGQLADKLEKARLIRWIKLWEVAVMGVVAVGFLTNNAWLLAGTLFLMGTQSAFFGPVKYAILPQALGKDSLVSWKRSYRDGDVSRHTSRQHGRWTPHRDGFCLGDDGGTRAGHRQRGIPR